MHYLVNRKVFETLEEARAYAQEVFNKTKIALGITETKRKVTHIYPLNK